MLRAHKAYTSNNDCYFIFLDVCDEYVARFAYFIVSLIIIYSSTTLILLTSKYLNIIYIYSGAEDKHGYLWDRHYGVCLAKFPHKDVVNAVAFNPCNPEMLVTASDDYTIKVWRSRAAVKALGLDENAYRRGLEVRKRHRYHRSNCNVD